MKRVSLIIPFNKERKVLLQHKGYDAPYNPNMWCLFGGSIENGEKSEVAIKREMVEELQIRIEPSYFKTTTTAEIERNYFSVVLDMDVGILKNQQLEGDGLGYFSIDEMKALKINEAHFRVISEFLVHLTSR